MTKSKYERALEALKFIGEDRITHPQAVVDYANEVYIDLTAPRMETVEVKRWMISNPSGGVYSDIFMTEEAAECKADKMPHPCGPIVELTGTYSRPIEEKEEVLTLLVKGNYSNNRGVVFLPKEWSGKEVEIRRLKGE